MPLHAILSVMIGLLLLALGLWLLAVAAEGAWAGPVTYLAVIALAGGGGILLMAAIEPLLRRS